MSTYTAEELKRAYQLGYSHGANGRPPLDGSQIPRAVNPEQMDAEPADGESE
jgi:hypothetical protein